MADLIDRQAAIKKISEIIWDTAIANDVKAILKELPSAQPERKTGRWEHDGSKWAERWVCDQCGFKLFGAQTDFCGGCGCRMMEVEHENTLSMQ